MTLWQQLQDLLNKISSTPRLLVGSLLVLILCWVLLMNFLVDWADDVQRDYATTLKKLTQTEQLALEDFWEERKKQSFELLSRIETRLWPIQNEGLARATLQNDITQIAEKSGLERMRIQIEKAPTDKKQKEFVKFSASITSWFTPQSLDKFLVDIANHDRLIMIDSFELRFKPVAYLKAVLSVAMPQSNTKPGVKNKDGGKL